MGADAVRAQQNNLGAPDMLMRGVAIPSERCQTAAVTGLETDGNSGSHAPDSHATSSAGNPSSDLNVRFDPLATLDAELNLRITVYLGRSDAKGG